MKKKKTRVPLKMDSRATGTPGKMTENWILLQTVVNA